MSKNKRLLKVACYDVGINSNSPSLPSTITAVSSVFPRAVSGRPSGYSEETVGRLCEAIRRRGMSDTAAGRGLGIARSTLARWKHEHPELEEWLAMAREQYREAKLAIVDEATTADGRPDWRAATWALQKAFPQDYGRVAAVAGNRDSAGGELSMSPVAGLSWTRDADEIMRIMKEDAERVGGRGRVEIEDSL